MWLFLAFLSIPLVEIALFISVGGAIGLWPTLAIVVATAIAGTVLMRREGRAAMERLRTALGTGQDPTGPIAHGAAILVAGVLLLTPGFFTDAVGLSLMLPPVRSALFRAARPWIEAGIVARRPPGEPFGRHPRGPDGDIVEAEYEEVGESRPTRAPGGSGPDSPWRPRG